MTRRRSLAVAAVALGLILGTTAVRADDLPQPAVTLSVRPIKIDGVPAELRLDQGKLYVSCFQGENVSVIDTKTRRAIRQLCLDADESTPAGTGGAKPPVRHYPPGDLVLANGKLFVGQVFSESIVVFDAATFRVVKRIPIAGEGNIAASADGKTVYFASNKINEFAIIDTKTYEFKKVAYPDGGRGIGSMAVSPDGKRLYLGIQRGGKAPDGGDHAGGNCFLAVYDLVKQKYAASLYLAQFTQSGGSDDSTPNRMLFSADGKHLYVGMFQSLAGIYLIDPDKVKIERSISFLPGQRNKRFAWSDPIGLATYQTWLISANRNNHEVVILDASTDKVLARLAFADEKNYVTRIVVDEDRIYLGDEGTRTIYEMNGRKLAELLRAAPKGKDAKPLEITLRAD